ncbi:MAG TPA: sulfotransferase [Bryobacteraceae bacterium]
MEPNFFIVGAPKSGTTSLYHYLDQHPQIFMSPMKEPCYFASEVRLENFAPEYRTQASRYAREMSMYLGSSKTEKHSVGYVSRWEDYVGLFDRVAGETIVGEASVVYLWSPSAARNIAARIPRAKIVAVLRHPVDRAWSQYLQYRANGYLTSPFREHIEACMAARNPSRKGQFSPAYPFLEFGMYYEQLRTWFELFPRENIQVCFYQDGLAHILTDLLRFLCVDTTFEIDTSRRYLDSSSAENAMILYRTLKKYDLWQPFRRLAPSSVRPLFHRLAFRKHTPIQMNEEDRRFLCEYYKDGVMKLEDLLQRDLHSWLI